MIVMQWSMVATVLLEMLGLEQRRLVQNLAFKQLELNNRFFLREQIMVLAEEWFFKLMRLTMVY